jgi:hypothetical protein
VRSIANRRSAIALTILLIIGAALRVVALDRVPPGLNQDEACNGYDAYSLLQTGRDQHGNRFPIVIQAFNDYRMALFDYSLIPVVAIAGLKAASVRMGAALWGIADLAAIALLAYLMLGIRGCAIALILAAISPWHLPLSRFGHEAMSASATISWATACFMLWHRRRSTGWLMLSALLFGLSLYTYSITKAFVPVWIVLLAVFYWNDVRRDAIAVLAAVAIVVVCAAPQAFLLWHRSAELQARFAQVSIFSKNGWTLRAVADFMFGLASHFSFDFLFIHGQRGLEAELLHPPGFGQLLTAQAAMVAAALCSLYDPRYRNTVILLLDWAIIAAIPAALTIPAPHMLRDVLAIAPWTILSALGVVFLLDLAVLPIGIRRMAAAALMIAVLWQGVSFVRFYFGPYATVAARSYQYGMEQVVRTTERLSRDREPIVVTALINQPYIYFLFYLRYPPALFQTEAHLQDREMFAPVLAFDRYRFAGPSRAFATMEHGIFVFPDVGDLPVAPTVVINYPDGHPAYRIVVK